MKAARNLELLRKKILVADIVNAFVDIAIDQEVPTAGTAKQWHAAIYNDYTAVEATWRQMESWGRSTVFQGYDWAASWYDAASFSGAAEPLVVVVSKEGGDVVWILPLCISRHKNLRIISFADLGITDYVAPLIAPGSPVDRDSVIAMLEAVFAVLPSCDLISFQKLVPDVQGTPNPLLFLRGVERFPVGSHGIRITEPWSELAPKIMQRRLRGTIRREKKNLEKKGALAIEHCDTPETLEPALERLLAMRRVRFKALGLPEMPPLWQNFYRILAMREDRNLNASITTLTANDEPIATCFGLMHGRTYHALLTTFKMGEWERYRPGMQLFDIMLTKFAEQTGNDGYFDFTIGDEVYKKRFGCDSHPLYEWMASRSLKGFSYYMVWRTKSYLRRYPRVFMILQKTLHHLRTIKSKTDSKN